MSRLTLTVLAVLMLAASASAEPLRWGYRAVNVSTGVVFGEQAGITDDFFSASVIPTPVLPPFGPTEADRGRGIYEPRVTVNTRVTITDEATGAQGDSLLQYTVGELWQYHSFEDIWNPISSYQNPWPTPGAAPKQRLGANDYSVSTEGDTVFVRVVPADTPEPATLALAGLGLAGLAAVRRVRSRKLPGAPCVA